MNKILSGTLAAASVTLFGCNQQESITAYKAKVTGSGCPFGGCVTAVRIITGPYAMKTCKLEYVKIEVGDTVLVSLGGNDDPTVCTLR